MSEWCQNKKCPEKKNQNQIRGSKGNKYYQSNKAHEYYLGVACSLGCLNKWIKTNKEIFINSVGEIDKQVLPLEDAWFVEYKWGYNVDEPNRYHLSNKLNGIDRVISQQQAQTPEQIAEGRNWDTIDDTQAKELAITLGLAS